jgi:hypothetical protein
MDLGESDEGCGPGQLGSGLRSIAGNEYLNFITGEEFLTR